MRMLGSVAILLVFGSYVPVTLGADVSVAISSPKDGDKFSSREKIKVIYKAVLGTKGNHLHLYLDDKEAVMIRKAKGSYMLEPLAPGKHGICIRVMNKEHAETGTQECVMFRVE